jgi:Tol biopolymer transport system component
MTPLNIHKSILILLIAGIFYWSTDAQTPGVECGCDTVGPYVAPYSKAIKVEDGPSYKEGTSPGGKYTVEATPVQPPNIVHLNLRCGSNTILSINSRATGWGFSPDGDRFVMHGLTTGEQHWIMLYNLNPNPSATGENADLVRQTAPTFVTSASVRFSPHGKYLLYAGLSNSGSLMLYVLDTETGEEA